MSERQGERTLRALQASLGLQGEERHQEAEAEARAALAFAETEFGIEHPAYALVLHHLATVREALQMDVDAERDYLHALAIRERKLPPDHPELVASLESLAALYTRQRRHAEAERFHLRTVAAQEARLGPEDADVARLLNNLAGFYQDQQRHDEAEALYRRAMEVWERALGPDDPAAATVRNNLASLLESQRRYAEAERLYSEAMAIWERRLGPEDRAIALSLNNLASLRRAQGDAAAADPLYRQALELWRKALGPGDPAVGTAMNNLAVFYNEQGRFAEAEALYRGALEVWEAAYGAESNAAATALANLAALLERQERFAEAIVTIRRATAIYAERAAAEHGRGGRAEQRTVRHAYVRRLAILDRLPAEPHEKLDEAFEMIQLARASEAAAALTQMAVRFASGEGALADRIRERQDLAGEIERTETAVAQSFARAPEDRDRGEEQELRRASEAARLRLGTLDRELARDFPDYAELSQPPPLDRAELQKLLAHDEALLAYVVGGRRSFLIALRRNDAAFFSIEVGEEQVWALVDRLRRGVDPTRINGEADLLRFDVEAAHELYSRLIAPAEPLLEGVRTLLVVPDGALQSLPLGALLVRPSPPLDSYDKLRDAPWLTRRYAVAILPAVSSLRALRLLARNTTAPQPFIGIGDPLLDGHPGDDAPINGGGRLRSGAAAEWISAGGRARLPRLALRGGGVDLQAVRSAPALPDTADELAALARSLGADAEALVLRSRATEPVVRRELRLDAYQVVAFATHGLVAGDLEGLGEPALILTPPDDMDAPPDRDGLLTASEIARDLRLNADWVILSACNTASPDGAPGAEGLSGLARAFIYAGARSLFVSHWPVVSQSTVWLTIAMFEGLATDPAIGRAEAHRLAQLALMENPEEPMYAHPLFWAPFFVVGEGGARPAAGD